MYGWKLLFRHPIQFCAKQIKKRENRLKEKAIEEEDKRKYTSDLELYIQQNKRDEFRFEKQWEQAFLTNWRNNAGTMGGVFLDGFMGRTENSGQPSQGTL